MSRRVNTAAAVQMFRRSPGAGLGALEIDPTTLDPSLGAGGAEAKKELEREKRRVMRAAGASGLGFGLACGALAAYIHKNHPVWAGIFGFTAITATVGGVHTLATTPSPDEVK